MGDTITLAEGGATERLPGYQPLADGLAGLYPSDADDYGELRDARSRNRMTPRWSTSRRRARRWVSASAWAFSACFHMEIVQERLSEYDLDIIFTAPSVEYQPT